MFDFVSCTLMGHASDTFITHCWNVKRSGLTKNFDTAFKNHKQSGIGQ
jgi:hypothetical protein